MLQDPINMFDPSGLTTLCEALGYFQINSNEFTDGSPFSFDKLVNEIDVIEEAGLNRYTDDGVDLAYFLVQYNATKSFPIGLDAVAGSMALGGDMLYILGSSTATAIRENRTYKDWERDIEHNKSGAYCGHFTAIFGWDIAKNLKNCPPTQCPK